jgi:hypothetical protein
MLAVAFGALAGMLTTTLYIVDDLRAFDLLDHFGLNGSTRNQRRANGQLVAANHQNFIELDFVASNAIKLFHTKDIPRLNLVLLAACLEDREHQTFLFISPRPVAPA